MAMQIYNLDTWELEVGRGLVQGQPGLNRDTIFKTKTNTTTNEKKYCDNHVN